MTRVLFINSGILGQRTFAQFIATEFAGKVEGLDVRQVVLTEGLTLPERTVRRVLCTRLWPDGAAGVRNLDLFRFRAEWNGGLVARRRLRQLEAAGERFDVLHFHHQATAYCSLDVMRRVPSIVSIDCTQRCVLQDAANELEALTYVPNVRRDGEIFRAARLIVSTSQWAAESLRAEYPDCTTDVLVLPNPVQLESFDATWVEARYARATSAGYRPRVLFMGGDFERKGGPDLLAAWEAGGFASQASLDLATVLPAAYRQLPESVTHHADVTPHSPRWRALWRDADLFAMPTRNEAFGLVFQEAAAAGLPSIGTRMNAIPELVWDGESGLLVEPRDVAALVEALRALLRSAERRRDMGCLARARLPDMADPAAYRQKLADAIRAVARARS